MISRVEYFKRVSGFSCSINEIGLFSGALNEYGHYTATAPYSIGDFRLTDMEETREEERERLKRKSHRDSQRQYRESLHNKPIRQDLIDELNKETIKMLRLYYYLGGFSTRQLSRVYGVDREKVKEVVLNKMGLEVVEIEKLVD